MLEASEVFLVWGINGWQTLPNEIGPPKTVIKNNVMQTVMDFKGDTFYTDLQVPSSATLSYGFLITKKRNGLQYKASEMAIKKIIRWTLY